MATQEEVLAQVLMATPCGYSGLWLSTMGKAGGSLLPREQKPFDNFNRAQSSVASKEEMALDSGVLGSHPKEGPQGLPRTPVP